MATAAQMEANRRNSQKSTGPRTEEGKNRSRWNALDHGCRASVLVLPTEDFGEYEKERMAWKLSFKPRNPAEEVLVDRLVDLGWQEKRIDRAQTARLTRRIYHAGIEEENEEQEQVLDLGQRLFGDSCGPAALYLEPQQWRFVSGRRRIDPRVGLQRRGRASDAFGTSPAIQSRRV